MTKGELIVEAMELNASIVATASNSGVKALSLMLAGRAIYQMMEQEYLRNGGDKKALDELFEEIDKVVWQSMEVMDEQHPREKRQPKPKILDGLGMEVQDL